MTAKSANMPEERTERDEGGSGGGSRDGSALTERRSGADNATEATDSTAESDSEATEGEATEGEATSRADKGKGKAVEEEVDDDEEDGEEEEEDESEEEDDDEDDSDEEDEEPRLKYARLTTNLGGLYRNGDATSAFLVAGDKMVGTHENVSLLNSIPY